MKTPTLAILAIASLVTLAAPATAQAEPDVAIARLCADEVSVNDVQECILWAEAAAQRAVDNAQTTCGQDITVNEAQRCVSNAEQAVQAYVDYAQDRVEDVLVIVCDVACNFVTLESVSAGSARHHMHPCGHVTVNEVQQCISWAEQTAQDTVDDGQDQAEYVLEYVCSLVCNFVSLPAGETALAAGVARTCPSQVTVNEVQRCVSEVEQVTQEIINRTQDVIEQTIYLVCSIACNFVAVPDADLAASSWDVGHPCGHEVTVNEVQRCITYAEQRAKAAVDDAQDQAEWVIDTVCGIACNMVAA